MKKILTFTFIIFVVFNFNAQTENEKINNSKIIELSKSGYSKPMLLKTIKDTDNFEFNSSLDSLKYLSENNIDDDVVLAMMKKQKEYNIRQGESLQIENINFKTNDYGLFYIDNNKKIKIDPHYSEGKQSSGFGAIVWKAEVENKKSGNIILPDIKEFYVNIDSNADVADKSLSSSDDFMEEALLFKMKRRGSKRYIKVGKSGMTSSKTKMKSKDKIDFKFEEIRDNFYKITIMEILKPGDYGFVFGGIKSGKSASLKIYDFTIEN